MSGNRYALKARAKGLCGARCTRCRNAVPTSRTTSNGSGRRSRHRVLLWNPNLEMSDQTDRRHRDVEFHSQFFEKLR